MMISLRLDTGTVGLGQIETYTGPTVWDKIFYVVEIVLPFLNLVFVSLLSIAIILWIFGKVLAKQAKSANKAKALKSYSHLLFLITMILFPLIIITSASLFIFVNLYR